MSRRPSPQPRPKRPTPAGARIRWDRLGRHALLGTFVVILYLYIGPLSSWVSTYKESQKRKAEVAQLKTENNRLKARARELKQPAELEREARRIGMVKLGERAYVIEGLPGETQGR